MSDEGLGRKRSRWEDVEGKEMTPTEAEPSFSTKKTKRNRKTNRERLSASDGSEEDLGTSNQSTPAQPTVVSHSPPPPSHSRFVPPRTLHPSISSCRSVYCYERLNHIEEGSYGIVFRARDKETGDIVALKKLKLDEEKYGFPITSLREIMALMTCQHENVVGLREIVVGDTLTQLSDFVLSFMDFVEHDLKTLLNLMPSPFLQSEVKTLLLQLLSAIAHCHANWVLHRDLKTSNLLMNNRGQIKVADFGLARKFGDPLGDMTQLVVTLWYREGDFQLVRKLRAPEILLGATAYSTAVDMWSVGCVFGELILNEPLFQAKNELDMVSMIFKLLGSPTEDVWPGFSKLPLVKTLKIPSQGHSNVRAKFKFISNAGLDLMSRFLTYDPTQRITAEEALDHPYFK
ncbi:hypothetical protein FRB98_002951 [Tulasnella sp. 332]|nr:hypothetical protein FRB98_002951 [Tulasnella sp. 332]